LKLQIDRRTHEEKMIKTLTLNNEMMEKEKKRNE